MLEAAIKLIVERGTEKTTLKDVGEHAGYSRGLAGYRFGSKQGLFEFVVRSIGESWLSQLNVVTTGKRGFHAMEAAINAHYHFCAEDSDRVRAFYMLWFGSIGPGSETIKTVQNIHERRGRDVARWVRDANYFLPPEQQQDPEAIAGQFSAAIIGIVYQWLTRPDDLSAIETLHEQLIETMKMYLAKDNNHV